MGAACLELVEVVVIGASTLWAAMPGGIATRGLLSTGEQCLCEEQHVDEAKNSHRGAVGGEIEESNGDTWVGEGEGAEGVRGEGWG